MKPEYYRVPITVWRKDILPDENEIIPLNLNFYDSSDAASTSTDNNINSIINNNDNVNIVQNENNVDDNNTSSFKNVNFLLKINKLNFL